MGMLVTHVEKVWAQWQVAGVLCMDVEAAFPSIAGDFLTQKMMKIRVLEYLVMWMLDSMMERWIHIVIDMQEG
jgi:hypothetical protein